jgi:hypothetical protein
VKPGERIALIQDIADALVGSDAADIDLILGQHGFRTGSWSGGSLANGTT